MPNGDFRAGKNARVSVNGVPLNKAKWEVDLKGDDIDSTNFESGGVDQGLIGIVGIDWSFGGLWDAVEDDLSGPPALYPRDNLLNLNFYENVLDNVFWSLPINRILSSKNGAEVRQAVNFETSGKLNGSAVNGLLTLPGGLVWDEIVTNAY